MLFYTCLGIFSSFFALFCLFFWALKGFFWAIALFFWGVCALFFELLHFSMRVITFFDVSYYTFFGGVAFLSDYA